MNLFFELLALAKALAKNKKRFDKVQIKIKIDRNRGSKSQSSLAS